MVFFCYIFILIASNKQFPNPKSKVVILTQLHLFYQNTLCIIGFWKPIQKVTLNVPLRNQYRTKTNLFHQIMLMSFINRPFYHHLGVFMNFQICIIHLNFSNSYYLDLSPMTHLTSVSCLNRNVTLTWRTPTLLTTHYNFLLWGHLWGCQARQGNLLSLYGLNGTRYLHANHVDGDLQYTDLIIPNSLSSVREIGRRRHRRIKEVCF